MIAYLKGTILEKNIKSVTLLANGIGYEVFLSPKELEKFKLEQEVELYIHSYIKEDAFDLYGFETNEELDFFRKLISVSGVGPKSALNVLAIAEVDDLKRAISSEDASLLQKVSGIGKKTAERLVVELKEKFIVDLSSQAGMGTDDMQVVGGLVSLGYKDNEAREIVKQISKEGDLASRIKEALRFVNNGK